MVDWTRYKDLKKLMQKKCRSTYINFDNNMLSDDETKNPKKFWSFIKSKRCDNVGIASLLSNGIIQMDGQVKANLLNDQFASVFTNEDPTNIPDLGPQLYPTLPLRWCKETTFNVKALHCQWP